MQLVLLCCYDLLVYMKTLQLYDHATAKSEAVGLSPLLFLLTFFLGGDRTEAKLGFNGGEIGSFGKNKSNQGFCENLKQK